VSAAWAAPAGAHVGLAVLRAASQGVFNPIPRWACWVWGAVLVLVPGALGLWFGWAAGRIIGGVMALAVVLCAWVMLAYSVQQQNHPKLARLLPGHVAGLRRTLTVAWAALVFLAAAISWAWPGNPWVLALPAAWGLWFLAASARWPLLWAVVWVPGSGTAWLMQWPAWRAAVQPFLEAWQSAGAVAPLAGVLLAGWALRWTVAEGGAAHERQYQRAAGWRQATRGLGRLPVMAAQDHSLTARIHGWTRRGFLALHARWLNRASPAGQPQPFGHVALVLGPQAHLAGQWVGVLIFWTVLAVVTVLLHSHGVPLRGPGPAQGLGNVCIGAMAYLASVLQQTRQALLQTRGEQALALLCPGTPHGGVLNQALARHLLLQYLGLWGLLFGPLTLLLWLLTDAHSQALAFAGISLALGVVVFSSHLGRQRQAQGLRVVGLYMVPMALAGGLAALMHWGWLAPAAFAAGLLVACAAWLAWRWPRLARQASAWPVGRF
jgi:hypothetical protein